MATHLLINPGPPPLQPPQPSPPRIQKAKENHHDTECEAGIKRCGEGHSVFAPPGGSAAAEVGVEEEADEGPDGEVETGLGERGGGVS